MCWYVWPSFDWCELLNNVNLLLQTKLERRQYWTIVVDYAYFAFYVGHYFKCIAALGQTCRDHSSHTLLLVWQLGANQQTGSQQQCFWLLMTKLNFSLFQWINHYSFEHNLIISWCLVFLVLQNHSERLSFA